MTRYLTVSAALHGALLAVALFASRAVPPKAYYGFQFLGGQSGRGTGRLETAPPPAPAGKSAPAGAEKASKAPSARDKDRVAVPSKKAREAAKSPSKKGASAAKSAPAAAPARAGGVPGGRGTVPGGKGDVRGAEEGPVGGVGNSLEIGGFGPGGGTSDTRFPFAWYAQIVYQRLWRSWEMREDTTRECTMAFVILRDGEVDDVRVQKPSGDTLFDFSARRAVVVSAPFPPLPQGYPEPSLPVVVRFRLQ
jgi:TonB family protein